MKINLRRVTTGAVLIAAASAFCSVPDLRKHLIMGTMKMVI